MKKYLGKLVLSALVLTSPIWGYNCNKSDSTESAATKPSITQTEEGGQQGDKPTEPDIGDLIKDLYNASAEAILLQNKFYVNLHENIEQGKIDYVQDVLNKNISKSLNSMKWVLDKYESELSSTLKETLEKQIKVAEDYLNK